MSYLPVPHSAEIPVAVDNPVANLVRPRVTPQRPKKPPLRKYRLDNDLSLIDPTFATSAKIIEVVGDLLMVNPRRMMSFDRHRIFARARFIVMAVFRRKEMSETNIAIAMGMDRSTVNHGLRVVDRTPHLKARVDAVCSHWALREFFPPAPRATSSPPPVEVGSPAQLRKGAAGEERAA